MIKATKLLREELQNIIDLESPDVQSDSSDSEDEDVFFELTENSDEASQSSIPSQNEAPMLETDQEPNEILEEVANMITSDSKSAVNCVRCSAHTLQLVVMNAIKGEKLSAKISKCRNLAKTLRKPTNAAKIKNENHRYAKLSCPTRWNSAFDIWLNGY